LINPDLGRQIFLMLLKQPTQQLLLLNTHSERLKVLQQLLEKQHLFHVISANCARDAIDILKTQHIDFVVSNINLDDFDGWRFSRLIRSGVFRCSPEIPIVIVANTWCEHIAHTTAREFGINQLIAFSEHHKLLDIIHNEQRVSLEDRDKLPLLIIEDNQDTRHLVSRILGSRFKMDLAEDGETGLNLWKTNQYSLVLLDVMLPGMSGNQVLAAIMEDNPNQSVVIMTANHTMELAEELMLKGAADFITKPFRAEQLRRVCETASRREDFMISNSQFAAKVESLNESRIEYKKIFDKHQQLLDQLGSVIIEMDGEGRIVFLNKAWEKLTGFLVKDCLLRPFSEFINIVDSSDLKIRSDFDTLLVPVASTNCIEFKLRHNNNEELWVEGRFETTLAADNRIRNISGTIDNVTAKKNIQNELEYQTIHDGLTGLYNRHYFELDLKLFAATAARNNGPHSLLYIDLDHFKVINDTLGHHQGDVALKNMAELIATRLRDTDVFSRVGGDEFALILPNTNQEIALYLANDICMLLDNYPCQLGEQIFKINCSIGISEINGSEKASEEYMKQADIALYAAKKQGRNIAHIYEKNDSLSKELQASFEWTKRVHQAVATDNLVLHFQPVVNILTRDVCYYEALVRLQLDGRIIPPDDFIPSLEREGNMSLLDRQVISRALRYLADNPKLVKIAINLSAQGFGDERLLPFIKEHLLLNKIQPNQIIFELTESASLNNMNKTRQIVAKIGELGCAFSIDDFGTGFSTFNYLKQLPAQSVKIDGSFVVDLATNPVDKALVKAIYEVATALNKKTVAEFVENEMTFNILKNIGITYAQGYHFGRPLPVEKLF